MAYLLRDSVAVYYEVRGSGPAILFSHGFGATGRMWAYQIEMLARNFKVILWDMRGHGRSDSPAEPTAYSQANSVDDIAAILDALGVQKAVIGGHSLGGFLSLAFHAKYPERVAALVLSSTGPGYRKDAPREAWNATANALADEIERGGLEWLRDRSAEVDPTDHKSAVGLINAGRRMLTQADGAVIESLPSISVPTFISVGSKDDSYFAATKYLEVKIKGSQRHVFEGAGHAANRDMPEKFNAALGDFLEANSAAFAKLGQDF